MKNNQFVLGSEKWEVRGAEAPLKEPVKLCGRLNYVQVQLILNNHKWYVEYTMTESNMQGKRAVKLFDFFC